MFEIYALVAFTVFTVSLVSNSNYSLVMKTVSAFGALWATFEAAQSFGYIVQLPV